MPKYKLGKEPPAIHSDVGSGPWCSAGQPSLKQRWLKERLKAALGYEFIQLKVGPEAIANMQHFLSNADTHRQLDMADVMQKFQYVRDLHDQELALAIDFANTLPPGIHHITSETTADGKAQAGTHAFYAYGDFRYWGQGLVSVEPVRAMRQQMSMSFEFHFFDRYNWDDNKRTQFTLSVHKALNMDGFMVKDEDLQAFHKECLAREYDLKGVIRKTEQWIKRYDPFDVLKRMPDPNVKPVYDPFSVLK